MLEPAEVSLLAQECDRALSGARLQKIHAPDPETTTLQFHGPSGDATLVICVRAGFLRAHLSTRTWVNPKTPDPFVTTLRTEVFGARVQRVLSPSGERLMILSLRRMKEERPEDARLMIELFGRGNIVLLDGEDRVVTALREAGRPERRPGSRYELPLRRADRLPSGPEAFAFLTGPVEGSWNVALDAWVTPREAEGKLKDLASHAASALRKRIKKEARLVERLDDDLANAARAPEMRRLGELLKHNLASIKKGTSLVEVSDFSSGLEERITVPLDPKVNALDNMKSYFTQARKLERGINRTAERAAIVKERFARFERLLEHLEAASTPEDLDAMLQQIRDAGVLSEENPKPRPKSKAKEELQKRRPYKTFVSADGIEILVGRTSADNDELTFRVARGNDYWLHVADHPGSHVVIRHNTELPPETLLDAATLAVHFSKIAGASRCDVSYTQTKHVKKFKGARPGQVQLAERKTIRVRVETKRLDRLLGKRLDA